MSGSGNDEIAPHPSDNACFHTVEFCHNGQF